MWFLVSCCFARASHDGWDFPVTLKRIRTFSTHISFVFVCQVFSHLFFVKFLAQYNECVTTSGMGLLEGFGSPCFGLA